MQVQLLFLGIASVWLSGVMPILQWKIPWRFWISTTFRCDTSETPWGRPLYLAKLRSLSHVQLDLCPVASNTALQPLKISAHRTLCCLAGQHCLGRSSKRLEKRTSDAGDTEQNASLAYTSFIIAIAVEMYKASSVVHLTKFKLKPAMRCLSIFASTILFVLQIIIPSRSSPQNVRCILA